MVVSVRPAEAQLAEVYGNVPGAGGLNKSACQPRWLPLRGSGARKQVIRVNRL